MLMVYIVADDKKRNAVFCWCRKKKIDIACLQETHEVLLSSLKKNDYEDTETGRDNTGRKISCVVKISNTYNVNIYNVYVPNLGNGKKIFINQFNSIQSFI